MDKTITDTICEKLAEIERTQNVKILHCVESGSRAWGFASPDSDYDVRFIYVRRTADYLRLHAVRDVIEWQLDETLDINGWDLQKTLRLLHSSNPTLFEWNSSPIVYRSDPLWKKVSDIIVNYFKQKSGLYHYLSMAKRNCREFLMGDTVRLKKYLYVLRPILACKWIIKTGAPPPMLFTSLMPLLPNELVPAVNDLLDIKMHNPEIAECPRIDAINDYIMSAIPELERSISEYKDEPVRDWNELDEIFLSALKSFDE